MPKPPERSASRHITSDLYKHFFSVLGLVASGRASSAFAFVLWLTLSLSSRIAMHDSTCVRISILSQRRTANL
eukprot:1886549-Amphidinium_carterae.2